MVHKLQTVTDFFLTFHLWFIVSCGWHLLLLR